MTYDLFLEYLIELGIEFDKKDILTVEWTTGGQDGVNCFGGRHQRIDPEPEPEFKDLEKIVDRFAPTLSYRQYKEIACQLVRYSKKTEDNYYGNFEDKAYKKILLKELYKYLEEKGFFLGND